MKAVERDGWTLSVLASMPFLDRLELTAVMDTYEEASHRSLRVLETEGLVGFRLPMVLTL